MALRHAAEHAESNATERTAAGHRGAQTTESSAGRSRLPRRQGKSIVKLPSST